jgi:hypothetical protein
VKANQYVGLCYDSAIPILFHLMWVDGPKAKCYWPGYNPSRLGKQVIYNSCGFHFLFEPMNDEMELMRQCMHEMSIRIQNLQDENKSLRMRIRDLEMIQETII